MSSIASDVSLGVVGTSIRYEADPSSTLQFPLTRTFRTEVDPHTTVSVHSSISRASRSPSVGLGVVCVCTQRIVTSIIKLHFGLQEAPAPGNVDFVYVGDLVSDDGRVAIWHWPPVVTKPTVPIHDNVKIVYDYSHGSKTPIVDEQWGDIPDSTSVENGETTGVTWTKSESKKNEEEP